MTRFELLAERALDAAAPEGSPWSVVDQRALPPDWRPRFVFGWTSWLLPAMLEPFLRRWGRYRGDGLALIVNPPPFVEDTRREVACRPGRDFERAVANRMRATVCHEAGHAIEGRQSDLAGVDLDAKRAAMPTTLAAIDGTALAYTEPTPCPHHGPRWVRATLHLRYRLELVGFDLGGSDPIGDIYALPSRLAIEHALHDEIRDLRRLPISEILDRKPPKRFARLFD